MIGNRNTDDFKLACIGCGVRENLMHVAHRDRVNFIVGYLFLCGKCLPLIGGYYRVSLVNVRKEKAPKRNKRIEEEQNRRE